MVEQEASSAKLKCIGTQACSENPEDQLWLHLGMKIFYCWDCLSSSNYVGEADRTSKGILCKLEFEMGVILLKLFVGSFKTISWC